MKVVNTDRTYLVLMPLMRPWIAKAARQSLDHFETATPTPGQVVLLGDSLTQGGLWDAWLPEFRTLNRGIAGDTTEDVLARLDSAIDEPVLVSVLIGTNDLHFAKRLRDIRGIAARVERILSEISTRAPNATILLNSVPPRTAWFAPRLRALNGLYEEVAARNSATFVDLWDALANESGALREEFTTDNIHLQPAGYEAWAAVLRPVIARSFDPLDS